MELAEYTGSDTDLFRKSLKGFDEDDIAGMVDLYNHFAYESITEVYIIGELIYAQAG